MTPKLKAIELIDKMLGDNYHYLNGNIEEDKIHARKFALIAVDECIESIKQLVHHYTKLDEKKYSDIYLSMSLSVQYWQEVKQEIEKL